MPGGEGLTETRETFDRRQNGLSMGLFDEPDGLLDFGAPVRQQGRSHLIRSPSEEFQTPDDDCMIWRNFFAHGRPFELYSAVPRKNHF